MLTAFFCVCQDKRDGISGHIFWKDFVQVAQVAGSDGIGTDTFWRIFIALNHEGGGYLSYREFVEACYVLISQEPRIKHTLLFAAFSEGMRSPPGVMTIDELKKLLVEVIVGSRTSEWRAYPRKNITMEDFDSLVTLMAEAAVCHARKIERQSLVENLDASNSSQKVPSADTSPGSSPGMPKVADGLSLEQWHKYASTQQHIQTLVAVLNRAGARIKTRSISAPEEQSDYE